LKKGNRSGAKKNKNRQVILNRLAWHVCVGWIGAAGFLAAPMQGVADAGSDAAGARLAPPPAEANFVLFVPALIR